MDRLLWAKNEDSGLLKTVTAPAGGNTFQGWENVFQNAVYGLNLCSVFDAVSPIARFLGSSIQGVEIRMPLLLPLVTY